METNFILLLSSFIMRIFIGKALYAAGDGIYKILAPPFSFLRNHRHKTFLATVLLLISFRVAGFILDTALNYYTGSKTDMRNALLLTDIVAISAESKINYIPDYCWQIYVPP